VPSTCFINSLKQPLRPQLWREQNDNPQSLTAAAWSIDSNIKEAVMETIRQAHQDKMKAQLDD
jgi:hypothetical protein